VEYETKRMRGHPDGRNETMKKQKRIALILAAILLLQTLYGCSDLSALSSLTATTMRLVKVSGTVKVTLNDKDQTVREDMKLLSGTEIRTKEDSLAGIGLDDVKAVTLSEETKAEVTQKNKKLELNVLKGEIYFKVMEPLADDESFDIRTSSMTVGIRGTSGYVKVLDKHSSQLVLTSGKVEVSSCDETVIVNAGEKLTVEVDDDTATFEVIPMTTEDLPEFVLDEIHEDDALSDMIEEALGDNWEDTYSAYATGGFTGDGGDLPAAETETEEGGSENGNASYDLPEGYLGIYSDISRASNGYTTLASVEPNGDGTYTAVWNYFMTGSLITLTKEEYDAIEIGSPFPDSLLAITEYLAGYKCITIDGGNKYLVWEAYGSLQEAVDSYSDIYRVSSFDSLPDGRIPLYGCQGGNEDSDFTPIYFFDEYYENAKTIIAENATIKYLKTNEPQKEYAEIPFREFYESGLTSAYGPGYELYFNTSYDGWRDLGPCKPDGSESGVIIRLTEETLYDE
jgi:hypothetical protein